MPVHRQAGHPQAVQQDDAPAACLSEVRCGCESCAARVATQDEFMVAAAADDEVVLADLLEAVRA